MTVLSNSAEISFNIVALCAVVLTVVRVVRFFYWFCDRVQSPPVTEKTRKSAGG